MIDKSDMFQIFMKKCPDQDLCLLKTAAS